MGTYKVAFEKGFEVVFQNCSVVGKPNDNTVSFVNPESKSMVGFISMNNVLYVKKIDDA